MKKIFSLMAAALMSLSMMAQKAQVWDFGAEQLDATQYDNRLSVAEINSWYPGVEGGTSDKTIGDFTATDSVNLKFVAGGKTNHRIRTTNTAITRYDSKSLKDVYENVYSGYLYSNYSSTNTVYLEQTYEVNDKIEFYVGSNGNAATYEVLDPKGNQTQFNYNKDAQIEKITFYAGATGKHRIYCLDEKLVVARIVRTPATYVTLTGNVSAPADIPADYAILFTNVENGNVVEVTPSEGAYSVELALDYDYELSLKNANGFVIGSGTFINIEESEEPLIYNIGINAVDLVTYGGTILGLTADQLRIMDIKFTSDRPYIPELMVDAANSTFSVKLERNVRYDITVLNINDYYLNFSSVQAKDDYDRYQWHFWPKTRYAVTIVPTGASLADLAAAVFTFTRFDDEYVYEFTGTEGISLRDGVYSVKVSNTGAYTQLLTSNLRVEGAAVSKQIDFTADIHEWIFNEADFTGGGYTNTSETYTYKTLQFKGAKSHNNTYLYAGNGAEINVPVKGNCVITVNACYEYHLKVGETVLGDTKTGSTSQIDALTYNYEGAAGFVTINATGTSYINSISVQLVADYKEEITVGEGKDYATINDALEAVARMTRSEGQTVTILIEPGNYEEMLRIKLNDITLKNAAAVPSLALANGGVDIDENAVRITSYYGHGYNYYSMNADYRWDARTLAVNKENGYFSTVNAGGTSTTYWNSTVVVYGKNFSAEGIIFENSFNQYISQKESEDISSVVDKLPARPTTVGSTGVQVRNYRERACALAFAKGSDRGYLKNCRIVGRQDAIYGDNGVRVAIEGGILNGACDYIFGAMTLAVKKAQLALLVTSDNNDVAYITASKSDSGKRGYLFYECSVVSATPGVDMVETEYAKPGYWGRPWSGTAETVFFKTKVGKKGTESLIAPAGWNNGLVSSGSTRSYEYGTVEESGVDNSANRISWATVLSAPKLPDNTEITLLNFTKGTDNWQPFSEDDPEAIDNTEAGVKAVKVLRDGQVIIVRDGKEFNILGNELAK